VAAPTAPRPGRAIALIALVVIALYSWMFISGNTSPKLGLDLRGGTSLTLKPVVPPGTSASAITDDAVNQAVNIVRDRVDGQGVSEASVTKQGTGSGSTIVVEVPGQNEQDLFNKIGKTAKLGFRPVLLSGSPVPASATASPTPSASASPSATGTATAKPSATPAATPSATASGNGRPATGLKAATATSSPTSSAASTATSPAGTATPTPLATPSATTSASGVIPNTPITAAVQAQFDKLDCTQPIAPDKRPADIPTQVLVTCGANGAEKYILGPELIPGSDITGATAALNTNSQGVTTGEWVVNLTFNGNATSKFAQVTREMYAQTNGTDANRFAIVLDAQVISAPTVNGVIADGRPQISGSFTQATASDLANQLKYGALPLAFESFNLQTISPTLGSDQLRAGIFAGLLGLLLVVFYSLFYYRGLGLVTVASLLMAGLLTFGSLVLLGHTMGYTLSLAGIAGAIVSIGITADSFVVLFERVRDEMRDGRTLRVAVETGWKRAQRTILAADAVSLIAAIALYLLAVGGVQGFAFTLGLTTLIDVVVVFLFTKPLLTRLARTKFFGSGNRWSGVAAERLGIIRPLPSARAAARRAATKEA
jgi:preprotein translocase subunit SecD